MLIQKNSDIVWCAEAIRIEHYGAMIKNESQIDVKNKNTERKDGWCELKSLVNENKKGYEKQDTNFTGQLSYEHVGQLYGKLKLRSNAKTDKNSRQTS